MASKLTYWERRQVQNMYGYMQKAEDSADQISRLYRKASRYTSLQTDEIFEKYQSKYGLSEKEARELINTLQDKTSLDELLQKLRNDDSTESKKELLTKLEAPAYQARLERFRQLQNQLDLVMNNVYRQEKDFNTRHYVDLADDSYYRGIYDVQQRANAAFSFNHIDPKQIDNVVNSRWSGKNYSSRIWSNTAALAQDVKVELLINLVTGRTNREAAEIIANKFGEGASNARRLIRTESNYVATEMNFKAYEDCSIEKYLFLATLDLRTSKVCQGLDGKIFLVKDRIIGENCPPMHPWCRSTTISVVKEELLAKLQRSAIDPATGERIKVPLTMNYEQWYEKHVKGKPAAEQEEKKAQNKDPDRKQYENYKNLLGDKAPKSFADFQNMKYNNKEKWNQIKNQMGMLRKEKNIGAFKHLSERMTKKHIRDLAKEYGIDIKGIHINIDANEELLKVHYAGRADPESIGGITFFPNAFSSREELVRTLYHEKLHVQQFRQHGTEHVQEHRAKFEKITYDSEDEFIKSLKKEGRL